jgi:hypothetical protein
VRTLKRHREGLLKVLATIDVLLVATAVLRLVGVEPEVIYEFWQLLAIIYGVGCIVVPITWWAFMRIVSPPE